MNQQEFIQILMSAAGSLGFSVLYNVRGRRLFLEALGGGLSWAMFLLLEPVLSSVTIRYFLCAAFAATYAEILARKLKTPATTFLIPAIIPHIPGGALYQAMQLAVNNNLSASMEQAFYTAKLALALAMGTIAVLSIFNIYNVILRHIDKGGLENEIDDT